MRITTSGSATAGQDAIDGGGDRLTDGGRVDADDTGIDAPAAPSLGDAYLVYYEDGGVFYPSAKARCNAPLSFGAWTSLLAPTRLEIATAWPADLLAYRVVAIAGLGTTTSGRGLSSAQQASLDAWLKLGGTLLLITDYDFDSRQAIASRTANALLTSLTVGIQIDGPLAFNGFYDLRLDAKDPLANGVTALHCGSTTALTVTAPAAVLDATPLAPGKAILAAQRHGSGRVVVLADQTCASDYTITSGSPPLYENCAVSKDSAASLKSFLQNLAR